MCYIRKEKQTEKFKHINRQLDVLQKERREFEAQYNKRYNLVLKKYRKEEINCYSVIQKCGDRGCKWNKCKPATKKKKHLQTLRVFKCVTHPDRCEKQCNECKYAVRCMKIGRHQSIFPHKTNFIKRKPKTK